MCIKHHTHCSVESVAERGAAAPSLSLVCRRGHQVVETWTSHVSDTDPGADSLSSPHLRMNCADLAEDSWPGRIKRLRVSTVKNTHLKPSCHRTRNNNHTTHAVACPRNGPGIPPTGPSPGADPPIYPSSLPLASGNPLSNIFPKNHEFFVFFMFLGVLKDAVPQGDHARPKQRLCAMMSLCFLCSHTREHLASCMCTRFKHWCAPSCFMDAHMLQALACVNPVVTRS